MVLVRRDVAEAQLAKLAPLGAPATPGINGTTGVGQSPPGGQPSPGSPAEPARPRRFYAKITLDPNRPTPQVSNIAQSILSELDRARGTTITLTLDIDAETADGFSEDIQSIVRDNAVGCGTDN